MLRKAALAIGALALVGLTMAAGWPEPPMRTVWMHPASLMGPWQAVASDTPWQGTVYLQGNAAALEAWAEAVSTPGSPEYRHFLTPQQLAARFGPSAATVASVRDELRQEGFRVLGTTAAGFGLRVAATAAVVDRAWQAGLMRNPDGSWVETRPVVLQGPMAQSVSYISNLGHTATAPSPTMTWHSAQLRPAQIGLSLGNVQVSVVGPTSVPTGQPIHLQVHATDPFTGAPLAGWQVTVNPVGDTGSLSSYALSDVNGNMQLDQNGNDELVVILHTAYSGPWQVQVSNGLLTYDANLPSLSWTGPTVVDRPLTPTQVNQAYQATNLVSAAQRKGGMRIGIFASSAPTLSDLSAFENAYHLPNSPVNVIPVDGGQPQVVSGWHGELMLDMERAVSSAPGATLDLYTISADSGSPLDVIAQVVQNNQDQVFSMSVVLAEDQLSAAEAAQWNALMAQTASEGITLVAGSGDSGPYADPDTNQPVVNWPAASHWVTAVGGTEVGLTPNGTISSQWGWGPDGQWQGQVDGSGGGFSQLEPIPSWQKPVLPAGASGRGVPDVAFLATYPYYTVYDNGQWTSMGGTSAATPTWGGWVADMAVLSGRLGFLNPTLYALYQSHPNLFDPVTQGGNAVYSAGPGWNPVAGLGSVWVDAFWQALAPATLKLSASASQVRVGQSLTVTASLYDPAGRPLPTPGVSVTLTVTANGPVEVNGVAATTATATTNGQGVASFTLTATSPLTATLTASAALPQGTVSAPSLTVSWAAAPIATVRLQGATRTATAAAVAEAAFPNGVPSGTAILTDGEDSHLVDALTAAPLARVLDAPILLTDSTSNVGSATMQAMAQLGIHQVILIGADAALATALPAGITVTSVLSGASRFDTAAAIARAVAAADPIGFSTVFLASADPAHLVDALSADPAAAMLGAPILLVPSQGGIPASELPFLQAATKVYVVGAAAQYPLGIANAVALTGPSRFATAAAIDQAFFPHPTALVIANGEPLHLVDALSGGPYAAALRAPLVLTEGGTLPPAMAAYLNALNASALQQLVILGGPASIPDGTSGVVQAALSP